MSPTYNPNQHNTKALKGFEAFEDLYAVPVARLPNDFETLPGFTARFARPPISFMLDAINGWDDEERDLTERSRALGFPVLDVQAAPAFVTAGFSSQKAFHKAVLFPLFSGC